MQQVTLDDAKRRLGDLIEAAVKSDEVVITKGDRPVVKLVPVAGTHPLPRFGSAKGLIAMADKGGAHRRQQGAAARPGGVTVRRPILRIAAVFLVAGSGIPASGQIVPLETVSPRGREAVRAALSRGIPPVDPSGGKGRPASRFRRAEKRVAIDKIAGALAPRPEDRAGYRDLLAQVLTFYEEATADSDLKDDVAGALAVLVSAHYALITGKELPEAAVLKMARQLQAALEVEKVRDLPDTDKQAVYEWAICTAGLWMSMQKTVEESGGEDPDRKVPTLAAKTIGELFGVDAKRVAVGEMGIEIQKAPGSEEPAPAGERPPAPGQPAAAPGELAKGKFVAPRGWTEGNSNGIRTFVREYNEFGVPERYTLLVLAPRPRTDSIEAGFDQIWQEVIVPGFETSARPLPFKRRLKGGFECAFDNLEGKRKAGGGTFGIGLYVVDTGSSLASVVSVFDGFRDSLNKDLEDLLDGFTCETRPARKSLFDAASLASTWRAGGNSFADLVNASTGNYVGDASISYGETMVLKADGTYTSDFAAISGSRRIRTHEAGRYRLEDDLLKMVPSTSADGDAKPTSRRIYGLRTTADGRGRVLVVSLGAEATLLFTARSSSQFTGEWFRREP